MPRGPLSVIIPTVNARHVLAHSAAALMVGNQDGLIRELIISDGESDDDISALATALGANFLTCKRGRGNQLHAAAQAAHGDWFLFIHADTALGGNWPDIVRQHIATRTDAGFFRLQFSARGFAPAWIAGWANFRSRYLGLPYGDQGLLISRDLYFRIGGYPLIPLMEDIAIARKLRGQLRMLDCPAVTNPARYVAEGWFNRGLGNLILSARYFLGEKPEKLAVHYRAMSPRETSPQTPPKP
ncbi:MAG: TIGR04283 family arsenosugar biosynthesis glycosyltransferase [Rhodobacteraceae bacterium]|nr:TIGR04283 family arsenosugar biosynthesis glycosyltransferase [Paracoccaceae bacterium]